MMRARLEHPAFTAARLAVEAECAPEDPRIPKITATLAMSTHVLFPWVTVACENVLVRVSEAAS